MKKVNSNINVPNFNKDYKDKDKLDKLTLKDSMAFFGFLATLGIGFGYPWLFGEICSNTYIRNDIKGLQADLKENVFGQHIANKYIISLLDHHVRSEPTKALALHFYGPTGTGKNLVASYIVKNLLKEGKKSHYYHYFNGMKDFSDATKKDEYRENIKYYVQKGCRSCVNNIFVFDEVDKIVPGVLDVLVSYIDSSRVMYGVDYRQAIFIFLSNSSGEDLVSLTSKYLESGKARENITYEDMLPLVKEGKVFQNDGFKGSILKNLMTANIPFLPLEKEHIKKCIRAELKAKKWLASEDALNKIANELVYVENERFSYNGCRKVKIKIDLYISEFLNSNN